MSNMLPHLFSCLPVLMQAQADATDSVRRNDVFTGTVSYAPPEMLMGSPHPDASWDVYALGLIMWNLACASPLYPGESLLPVMPASACLPTCACTHACMHACLYACHCLSSVRARVGAGEVAGVAWSACVQGLGCPPLRIMKLLPFGAAFQSQRRHAHASPVANPPAAMQA